jgi:O-antigen ligase
MATYRSLDVTFEADTTVAFYGKKAVLLQLLSRFGATLAVTLAISSLIDILDASILPTRQLYAAVFFWTFALFTPTFGKKISLMFFWVLLLDSTMQLYQVALYPQIENKILRMGPIIISGLSLLLSIPHIRSSYVTLYSLWVLLHIPSLIGLYYHQFQSITEGLFIFFINVFFPLIFLYATEWQIRSPNRYLNWELAIAICLFFLAIVPLTLAPLELHYRDTSSLATLEYSRSYSVLGAAFLIWPIMFSISQKWNSIAKIAALLVLFLSFILSFSRGAALIGTILLTGTVLISSLKSPKFFLTVIGTLIVLALIANFFLEDWVDEALWFWLLRLNIARNDTSTLSFDFSESLDSGRNELWEMGLQLFKANPIMGIGIGSTPMVFSELSNGEYSFGGFHSLFLTVLVERGIFGFLALMYLLWQICRQLLKLPSKSQSKRVAIFSFGCFLLFANLTGVELFINSSRTLNVDITIFLLLFLAYLTYSPIAHEMEIDRKKYPR